MIFLLVTLTIWIVFSGLGFITSGIAHYYGKMTYETYSMTSTSLAASSIAGIMVLAFVILLTLATII